MFGVVLAISSPHCVIRGGVSARSQSSICVAVTPVGDRGPPLWFTALLLRVLEALGCSISLLSVSGQHNG